MGAVMGTLTLTCSLITSVALIHKDESLYTWVIKIVDWEMLTAMSWKIVIPIDWISDGDSMTFSNNVTAEDMFAMLCKQFSSLQGKTYYVDKDEPWTMHIIDKKTLDLRKLSLVQWKKMNVWTQILIYCEENDVPTHTFYQYRDGIVALLLDTVTKMKTVRVVYPFNDKVSLGVILIIDIGTLVTYTMNIYTHE